MSGSSLVPFEFVRSILWTVVWIARKAQTIHEALTRGCRNNLNSLCILCVLCDSVVKMPRKTAHHRDAENTEDAQRCFFRQAPRVRAIFFQAMEAIFLFTQAIFGYRIPRRNTATDAEVQLVAVRPRRGEAPLTIFS